MDLKLVIWKRLPCREPCAVPTVLPSALTCALCSDLCPTLCPTLCHMPFFVPCVLPCPFPALCALHTCLVPCCVSSAQCPVLYALLCPVPWHLPCLMPSALPYICAMVGVGTSRLWVTQPIRSPPIIPRDRHSRVLVDLPLVDEDTAALGNVEAIQGGVPGGAEQGRRVPSGALRAESWNHSPSCAHCAPTSFLEVTHPHHGRQAEGQGRDKISSPCLSWWPAT